MAVIVEPRAAKLAYSVPEAAELISVGRSTAWDLVNRGELKARRIGGRVIVLAGDIDAFLQGLNCVH